MRDMKRYGSVALMGVALAVGACSKSDHATDSTAAVAAATMPDSMAGANVSGSMSAANVASLVGLTNASEIGAAKIAQDKATNADVKAFAKQMIAEHQAMQHGLDSLTQAKNLTPTPPPAAAQKQQMADQMTATLNSTPKGAAFDKAYMDGQVQAHQQALNDLHGFSANAPDADLKTLIDGAIPKVQQHLDKAQQLQSKLNTTGS